MEEAVLEAFEVMGLVGGAEQALAELGVRIHRASDVHHQQQFDPVALLGSEDQVDVSAGTSAPVDGGVEVELVRHSLALESAQPPKSEAHLPGVEDSAAAQVAEAPASGNLNGRAPATGTANANSCRIRAAMAER